MSAPAIRVAIALLACTASAGATASVQVVSLPGEGIQPQAVAGADGRAHLVYFRGDPSGGDIYYATYAEGGFSTPVRVNSIPGSAMATGSVRGAHLALGEDDRPHVAWMAAQPGFDAESRPMYYTRMRGDGEGFEAERNVIQDAYGLDGGGSVAADDSGNVYVAWHAGEGEPSRRVYAVRSEDGGQTFAPEEAISDPATGVCACCGMRVAANSNGTLFTMYRTARDVVHRDMHLVTVRNGEVRQQEIDQWEIGGCPMSTSHLLPWHEETIAAWETEGQVYYAAYDAGGERLGSAVAASGARERRKHPVVARNARKETLLVWTEGTSWNRGGSLAWQLYGPTGETIGERGHSEGIPPWGFGAAVAMPGNGFVIFR